MLQRSPTYIASAPGRRSWLVALLLRVLPLSLGFALVRCTDRM